MADTGKIASAIIAALKADTASGGLMTLMTDGVWEKAAPKDSTKFVVVELVTSHDEPMFQGRAFEELIYRVKAIDLSTSMTRVKNAAARIDAVLDWQTLSVIGYGQVLIKRSERLEYPDPDPENPAISWQHCGGLYDVFAS